MAILSVSKKGYDLSFKLKELLDNDSTIIKCDIYYKDVKNTFNLLFYEYDAIIAIMASGILIRSISHLIESKTTDNYCLVSLRIRSVLVRVSLIGEKTVHPNCCNLAPSSRAFVALLNPAASTSSGSWKMTSVPAAWASNLARSLSRISYEESAML